jgi:chromosome partitioning protein
METGLIFAFTNSKGGVGKSTMAVNLATWLREQGSRVALVDADVQGSSSAWLQEASPETPIFRLQTPDDVLDQVPRLQTEFSHLVVDGPAGLSEVTRTILLLADCTYLPCGPSVLDLRAVSEALRTVRQVQQIRHGAPLVVLVPNKLQARHRLSVEFLETAKTLGVPAAGGLHLRQPYADAAGQGTVVWRMESASAGDAAAEMKSLLKELMEYERSESEIHDGRVANG